MSTDKTFIASCGDDVKVWDTSNLKKTHSHRFHDTKVGNICWNQDNNVLFSSSYNSKHIIVSEFSSGLNKIQELQMKNMEEEKVCMGINRNGRKLFACAAKATFIEEFDSSTLALKKSHQRPSNSSPASCLSVSKNDSMIATCSNEDNTISFIGIKSKVKQNVSVCENQTNIRYIKFSPWKDPHLAMALDDGSLSIWDAEKSQEYHNFPAVHSGPSTQLAFSPYNNMLVATVGIDRKLVLYDTVGKRIVQDCEADQPLMSVSVHHNGHSLFVGSTLGNIYKYDMRKFGHVVDKIERAHSSPVYNIVNQTMKRSSRRSTVTKSTSSSGRTSASNPSSVDLPSNNGDKLMLRRMIEKSSRPSEYSTTSSSSISKSISEHDILPPVSEVKTSTPVQSSTKIQPKSSTVSSNNFDSHLDLTTSTDGGGWEKNNLQNLNVTDFSSDTSFSHGNIFSEKLIPNENQMMSRTSSRSAESHELKLDLPQTYGSASLRTPSPLSPPSPFPTVRKSRGASKLPSNSKSKKDFQPSNGEGDTGHNEHKDEQIKYTNNLNNLPNGGESFQIGIIRDLIKSSEERMLDNFNDMYLQLEACVARNSIDIEDRIDDRFNTLATKLIAENQQLREENEKLRQNQRRFPF